VFEAAVAAKMYLLDRVGPFCSVSGLHLSSAVRREQDPICKVLEEKFSLPPIPMKIFSKMNMKIKIFSLRLAWAKKLPRPHLSK
jgi:hypothetical protein